MILKTAKQIKQSIEMEKKCQSRVTNMAEALTICGTETKEAQSRKHIKLEFVYEITIYLTMVTFSH